MSMLQWRDWMFYAAFFSDTSVANRVAYIRSNHRCRDCTCHFQNIEEKTSPGTLKNLPVQVITYQLNGGQFVLLKKCPDLEFVKKFTRPNFQAKEFYILKTRKSRLFSPAINRDNATLTVIWPSFG